MPKKILINIVNSNKIFVNYCHVKKMISFSNCLLFSKILHELCNYVQYVLLCVLIPSCCLPMCMLSVLASWCIVSFCSLVQTSVICDLCVWALFQNTQEWRFRNMEQCWSSQCEQPSGNDTQHRRF